MKFLLLFNLFICQFGLAQHAFVSTWKTDNPGTSNNSSITIPINYDVVGYAYKVDWNNDGVYDQLGLTGSVTHDFGYPGTYTIRIGGDFPAIFFDNHGDKRKLLDISQWGDISWKTFHRAFYGCINLNITATDAPDLSSVKELTSIFGNCSAFNSNINHWDVSNINDLAGAFENCPLFNQPLNNWDVSHVENMEALFSGASAFNQDIGGWQLDNLTSADYMFRKASSFNQSLNTWVFPKLTSLQGLFVEATSFNQDLSAWDVSKISNFSSLFSGASAFNQNLSTWDVANGTNFSRMFKGASSFNEDITNWEMGNALNTSYMFCGATVFDQNIGNWDLSKNQSTQKMFAQAQIFNQDISNWNMGEVVDMSHMFAYTDLFNQDISGWSTSKVKNMNDMFSNTKTFNQNIGVWDVSQVEEMRYMFNKAYAFNQNLNNWDVAQVQDMRYLFHEAILFNSPLDKWKTVSLTKMEGIFFSAKKFNQPIGNWDVSKVTNLYRVFRHAESFNQDLSNWDVSKATNMEALFYGAKSFNQNIGNWKVSNLENADQIFFNVPLSVANYDSLLIGWAAQNLKDNINFLANKAFYCLGKDARQSIIDTYHWTFDDAGLGSVPNAICIDTTIYIPYLASEINLDPMEIGAGSITDCSSPTLSLSQITFSCKDVNLVIKDTLWAKDANGFQDFCVANITVLDTNTKVVISCPNDTTVFARESNCRQSVTWKEPFGGCNVASIVSNFKSGDSFPLGENIVKYSITDNNSITQTCSFKINVISDLTVTIDSTLPPSCSDLFDGQAFVTTKGGVLPYAYDWNHDGMGDADDQSNEKLSAGKFIVQAIDKNGCSDFDTVNIVSNGSPAIIYCPNDTMVRANAATCKGAVLWDKPIAKCSEVTFVSNLLPGDILPLGTTTIKYTSTDLLGNQDVCEFDVTVYDDFEVVEDFTEGPDCADAKSGMVKLNTIGGFEPYSYHWNNDEYILNIEDFNLAEVGINTVVAFDKHGCIDTLEVIVPETLPLTLTLDTLEYYDSVNIFSTVENGNDPLKFEWDNGSYENNISIYSSVSKWFSVRVIDGKNCTVTDSIYLKLEIPEKKNNLIHIPNIFTPNGDLKNDTWEIYGMDNYEVIEMLVYNRWGGLVFKSNDQYTPWDGTSNGINLPDDTYNYFLRVVNDQEKTYRGFVIILR